MTDLRLFDSRGCPQRAETLKYMSIRASPDKNLRISSSDPILSSSRICDRRCKLGVEAVEGLALVYRGVGDAALVGRTSQKRKDDRFLDDLSAWVETRKDASGGYPFSVSSF